MTGRPTEHALAVSRAEIERRSLDGATEAEIAAETGLSERTVRRHLATIRATWARRNPRLGEARAWLVALAGALDRAAAQGASELPASASARVGYLKLRLSAQERIAKLLGADAPIRNEVAGPSGGPVRLVDDRAPLSRGEILVMLRAEPEELP